MYDRIMATADRFCPTKEFKFSNEKPVWLTNELIALLKERDRCLTQYQKTKNDLDNVNMRKARNLANISIKMARGDYIKDQLNTNKNDPKKFWRNIAEIIPNSKSNSSDFSNIHDEDNDIISQENLASHVNCFFSDIGIKLDKTIPPIENIIQSELPCDVQPLESFKCIEEIDFLTEINKISIYKSSGIKNLPTLILKLCFKALLTNLLTIINKSLFIGYFPMKWRRAIVVPIPKINVPPEIGYLRPIALIPLPGKIIKRFIHKQLVTYLDENNFITRYQNGFRKGHSTLDTIFRYTTDLELNKNNKYSTISLYIDFKKHLIL